MLEVLNIFHHQVHYWWCILLKPYAVNQILMIVRDILSIFCHAIASKIENVRTQ